MSDTAYVTLTERAVEKARDYMATRDGSLRLGVRGGGCSGYNYVLALDHPTDTDLRWEQDGVDIIMSPDSVVFLKGATLDYKDGLEESGFVFDNPNAYSSCGCGSSFRLDPYAGCGTGDAEEDAILYGGVYGDESAL